MDFFGMGMGEIILVLIVAVIIFGPNKIPEIARTIGKTVAAIKKTSSELTSQINTEINAVEEQAKGHMPPPPAASSTVEAAFEAEAPPQAQLKDGKPPVGNTGED